MKKLGDNTLSPVDEAICELAGDMLQAQAGKEYALERGLALEEDAQQQAQELTRPVTAEEARAVGALVTDSAKGNFSTQLKDTTKSPNIVNAAAHAERIHLSRETRSTVLATDITETVEPKNAIERDICHQMGAAHSLSMKFLAKSQDYMHKHDPMLRDVNGRSIPFTASEDAARYANLGIKLMNAYQQSALALQKLRGGGNQQVTVTHQHVQVAGGTVKVAGNVIQGRGEG